MIPPAVTPADAADDRTARFKFPTMLLVSRLGRYPKPQCISAMEHLFPFGGRGGQGRAPIMFLLHFFCLATLHDSLFWEAQVGTWDTKLTKHSVSLQWGQLVPWQCPWPCNPARWTTQHSLSWQSAVGKGASAACTISSSEGTKAIRTLYIRDCCRKDST